jgi:hypothetical protein
VICSEWDVFDVVIIKQSLGACFKFNKEQYYLQNTFPPIILNAGVPLINVSLAKMVWHFGQVQGSWVKSWVIRCLKHLSNDPLPPFRYLKS